MADSIFGDLAKELGGVAAGDLGQSISSILGEAAPGLVHALSDLQVDLSGLNHDAAAQVINAVQDLDHVPTPEEIEHLFQDAKTADEHKTAADALHADQVKAAEQGEFDKAHELSGKTEYLLQDAKEHGAALDHPIVEAQKEGAALDNASWQQQISHEAAHDTIAYVQAGDASHAADSAQHADDHAAVAADYGSHGGATTHDASHDAVTETDGAAA